MDSVLRSRPAKLLLTVTLLCSLLLGLAAVAVHRFHDARQTGPALSDIESRQQVVVPARQIVEAGSLHLVSATYLFVSCAGEDEPPYRGTVYLTFDVASVTESAAVFRQIAGEMTSRGWAVGLPPTSHPGGWTLGKDGISAMYYRHDDQPPRGVLEVYGECRNVADHRFDGTGFVDIVDELI